MAETTDLERVVDGVSVPPVGTYSLDKAHSVVGFSVRHVMVSKVRGHFNEFEGKIVIGETPAASSVETVIQIASIDTREEARDTHLRSGDFFEVEKFPEMTFKSTAVSVKGDEWQVQGDLTIKGVTKSVTLRLEYNGAAKDPWGGTRIGFSASTDIDREEFGLTYNAALEAGGVMIGKSVRIELEIEGLKDADEA